jgi:hypothetical protein
VISVQFPPDPREKSIEVVIASERRLVPSGRLFKKAVQQGRSE